MNACSHLTQQKQLSFARSHVNHQVSTWIIITGSGGGAVLGKWRQSVEELSFHGYSLAITDVADSTLGHYISSDAAAWQPCGSSSLCLGPSHPWGASRLRFAESLTLASGSRVTAGIGEPVCSHGCRRELGGYFQSHGDPGAQDQNKEEAFRATEGEGVSS